MKDPTQRKYFSEAAERNSDPIREVLRESLPKSGTVLEIASGTGQHAVFMGRAFPRLTWQPTEIDPAYRTSIDAWRLESGLENVLPPLHLDVNDLSWPVANADAVVNCNMIHITPWSCCQALMAGAARVLQPGGVLYMYGPYKINGQHTAPTNTAFDENLRFRDPAWGIRDLDVVIAEAIEHGFEHVRTYQMPANNLSVVYRKG